ncbi:diacylglycerol lipase-alpha isoform X1 [Narcine bancroftii]|uniref:diacylglycerol lipase-alpha isoform X1 n=1 Tax=Narcine bancroftii TaxID=1343680 RepID=UPI00383176CA
MPGIVIFRRRWSVGSDDLVLPGIFLFLIHTTWFVVLAVVLFGLTYSPQESCSLNLVDHGRGYLGILIACMISEAAIIWLSMRGSILYTEPRDSMQYILYIRMAIVLIEFAYAIIGIVWLAQYYHSCNDTTAKNVTLGIVACNWVVILSVCITVMCVFDRTGRTFVKLRATKRRQRNLRTYNLRHRLEEEQASSWSRRLKFFLCCTRTQDTQSDAYSEVAFLFAEFFRDLDIVPSDIIAGLVLLRQRQRAKRFAVLDEANNDILAFLSGIPVTRNTKYLDLKNAQEMYMYKEVCYYMHFALAAYGWPLYLMRNPTCGICKLASSCSCCCFCHPLRPRYVPSVTVEEDNCCNCNVIAIKRHFLDENFSSVDIVYTSCHDAVFQTPFYVAVDHMKKKVVISIRGTLSPKDALTDLTGDAERLPVEGHHGTWLGHKGMVLSAEYIKKKLEQEMILSQAFGRDLGKGTKHYGLVVVGHSLGAGTAAILSFLLRPRYPTLHCYAYSPPGGLLSCDAMEYSKEFVTSVILGKDLVPRLGLSQLEVFRRHLLDVLQKSNKPKWRIIMGGTRCIPKSELLEDEIPTDVQSNRLCAYPSDLTIALSASVPLYPPGRIIHVVHNHPEEKCCCGQEESTYYAIWSDNKTLDEVIISAAMLNEHMPHIVMDGLHKVLENYNKGKTALLGAAKVMVSPTEVDLNPDMIVRQQPQPMEHGEQRRNSNVKNKSKSEPSFEDLYRAKKNIQCQNDPVELLLMNTKERLVTEIEERRAPLATMESLSDNESVYSFDSRRSSGFRSIRGSPSLHVVMEKDESHCFYIDPAIPEENPSLSSRTELLAADSLSKHSQEVQPFEALQNSCYSLPSPLQVDFGDQENKQTAEAEDDSFSDKLPMEDESKEWIGGLREVPSPQVLEFAEFIDSLFNLDGKSSSFQDIYHLVLDDNLEEYDEIPKSVSEHEILMRAQFEPNLVPKPPRLFVGSADAATSSGISMSPSFPFSSSGELMDITPTCISSQECLTVDTKLRTSTPADNQSNSNKPAELIISAL